MITLESDRLTLRLPEVHPDATCSLDFQRTLRIPDDGADYPLPPGLGSFPLRHVDDYAERLPAAWLRRGGVLLPMHQAEAMWLSFGGASGYPFAIKVATGKICAVTGDAWAERLNRDPQDYLVVPEQPWLDGYCVERGVIRQFVAMPLGAGYTVEEQLTGAAEHGGLQIIAFPMKRQRYEQMQRERRQEAVAYSEMAPQAPLKSMGLAPGGRMRQEIYDDPYGLDAWDPAARQPLLRQHRQLSAVAGNHRRTPAYRAPDRGPATPRPDSPGSTTTATWTRSKPPTS